MAFTVAFHPHGERVSPLRARLDTRQVESDLDAIFSESPEFGRTLAHRLNEQASVCSLRGLRWFVVNPVYFDVPTCTCHKNCLVHGILISTVR
jgi:hypothetical protein